MRAVRRVCLRMMCRLGGMCLGTLSRLCSMGFGMSNRWLCRVSPGVLLCRVCLRMMCRLGLGDMGLGTQRRLCCMSSGMLNRWRPGMLQRAFCGVRIGVSLRILNRRL